MRNLKIIAVIAGLAMLYISSKSRADEGDLAIEAIGASDAAGAVGKVANPAAGAASAFSVSALVAEMKKQYALLIKELNELKAQSQFLSDVREGINYINQELDTIKNLDLDSALSIVKSDADSLTELDNLGGRDDGDKLLVLRDELDRRLKDPTTDKKDKPDLIREKHRIEELRIIGKLGGGADNNLATAREAKSTDKKMREVTAQNTGIIAKILAEQREQELQSQYATEKTMNSAISAHARIFREIANKEK